MPGVTDHAGRTTHCAYLAPGAPTGRLEKHESATLDPGLIPAIRPHPSDFIGEAP